jgi:hypothetical protein
MEAVRLGVEEAACDILEHLNQRLRPGAVDYESFGEVHYFSIRYRAARFTVRLPEHALKGKRQADLQPMIAEIIDHVHYTAACSSMKSFNSAVLLSFAEDVEHSFRTLTFEPTMPISWHR